MHIVNMQDAWTQYLKDNKEQKTRDSFYITDLARCPRGVFLERLGKNMDKERDDRLERVFAVGNMFEEKALDILRHYQKEGELLTQGSIVYPEYGFRGRYDALLVNGTDAHVIEFKTMHSQGFHHMNKRGESAKAHHIEQLQCYMHKLRDSYTNVKGSLIYISKDDLCVKQSTYDYDPEVMREALKKMELFKTAWDAQVLPRPIEAIEYDSIYKRWQTNWKATYCDYHVQCTGNPDWAAGVKEQVKERNK